MNTIGNIVKEKLQNYEELWFLMRPREISGFSFRQALRYADGTGERTVSEKK